MMQSANRKLYLDILRITACIFVIFNHTGTFGFQLFTSYKTGSVIYFILSFFTVLCKTAVPIFLMISGALLLGRDISLKELWLKKIPKFLFVLVAISFLYYLVDIKDDPSAFSFVEFLKQLYSTNTSVHLWYLYAYLAFLICFPFLNAMVKHLSDTAFYLLILVYAALCIVDILDSFVFNTSMYWMLKPSWLTTDIVLFPVIGYFVEHRLNMQNFGGIKKLIVGVAGFICLVFALLLSYHTHITTGQPYQTYYSFLVLIPSLSIYSLTKACFDRGNTNKFIGNLVSNLGVCTFGVYLIHMMLPYRGLLVALFYEVLPIPHPLSCLLYCLTVFFVCAAITYLFKKLPVVGKLV